MRAAKRVHSIELPHYLDQVYRETDAARTYIGVHELCYLTSEVPCSPGTHATSECLAHRTVESYHKIKVRVAVSVCVCVCGFVAVWLCGCGCGCGCCCCCGCVWLCIAVCGCGCGCALVAH